MQEKEMHSERFSIIRTATTSRRALLGGMAAWEQTGRSIVAQQKVPPCPVTAPHSAPKKAEACGFGKVVASDALPS